MAPRAVQKVDFTSQAFKRNPYPTLAELVARGPVVRARLPLVGLMWMATTHEAASELLRDRQTFVREPRSAGMRAGSNLPWWFPRSLHPLANVMINRDEPDHRRLRGFVEEAFLRRSIERMRPRIEAILEPMLDDLEAKYRRDGKPVDLVANLARPFPLAVICELLGLPEEDRAAFMKRAELFSSNVSLWQILRFVFGIRSTIEAIGEHIRRIRRQPREGLISELIAVEQGGDRLSEDELVSMVVLLLLAGHVTTVHLIGGSVLTLLEHADQKRHLQADWLLVETAVEELLRYLTPVQATKPMMPAHDLVWQGEQLRRGEKIVALLAAANMDPGRFNEPERFDMRRHPNPHLAFGAGIHVCLGLKLAKVETEIALQRLFTRFPGLELALPVAKVQWSRQPAARGPHALPVHLG